MKDTTAIIKTFLRDDYLFDCVRSLRTTYPEMPIAVADDGPFSQKRETTLAALGVSTYLRLPYNSGLSAGRNALVDVCKTPYLLVGDDDFLYTPDTHVERLRALMEVADIAGGGPIIDGKTFRYEVNFLRRPDGKFHLLTPKWPSFEIYQGIRYGKCDLVPNFFVAKTAVVQHIKWDAKLKVRYEHEDFFMAAWLQGGINVVYCPDVLVLHRSQNYPASSEYTYHRWIDTSSTAAFAKKWGFTWTR